MAEPSMKMMMDLLPMSKRVEYMFEQEEKSLNLDETTKRHMRKHKDHILYQRMMLRLETTKREGITFLEKTDFLVSYNISEDHDFEFDIYETSVEKLLIISTRNKAY